MSTAFTLEPMTLPGGRYRRLLGKGSIRSSRHLDTMNTLRRRAGSPSARAAAGTRSSRKERQLRMPCTASHDRAITEFARDTGMGIARPRNRLLAELLQCLEIVSRSALNGRRLRPASFSRRSADPAQRTPHLHGPYHSVLSLSKVYAFDGGTKSSLFSMVTRSTKSRIAISPGRSSNPAKGRHRIPLV